MQRSCYIVGLFFNYFLSLHAKDDPASRLQVCSTGEFSTEGVHVIAFVAFLVQDELVSSDETRAWKKK